MCACDFFPLLHTRVCVGVLLLWLLVLPAPPIYNQTHTPHHRQQISINQAVKDDSPRKIYITGATTFTYLWIYVYVYMCIYDCGWVFGRIPFNKRPPLSQTKHKHTHSSLSHTQTQPQNTNTNNKHHHKTTNTTKHRTPKPIGVKASVEKAAKMIKEVLSYPGPAAQVNFNSMFIVYVCMVGRKEMEGNQFWKKKKKTSPFSTPTHPLKHPKHQHQQQALLRSVQAQQAAAAAAAGHHPQYPHHPSSSSSAAAGAPLSPPAGAVGGGKPAGGMMHGGGGGRGGGGGGGYPPHHGRHSPGTFFFFFK